jgi:hypothetical protein
LARLGRQRTTGFAGQLHGAFVKTHLGIPGIIGLSI